MEKKKNNIHIIKRGNIVMKKQNKTTEIKNIRYIYVYKKAKIKLFNVNVFSKLRIRPEIQFKNGKLVFFFFFYKLTKRT